MKHSIIPCFLLTLLIVKRNFSSDFSIDETLVYYTHFPLSTKSNIEALPVSVAFGIFISFVNLLPSHLVPTTHISP